MANPLEEERSPLTPAGQPFHAGDREARREEEAQHRLAELEAEEERLRKAA